jgi:hypothetical protein
LGRDRETDEIIPSVLESSRRTTDLPFLSCSEKRLNGMIVRTWGAPFESQGKAVLRPYTFGGDGLGKARLNLNPAICETMAGTGWRCCDQA